MRLERLDGLFQRVHNDRLIVYAKHAVGQQRQSDDVIHMRMRQKDMTNTGHVVQRQIAEAGARVY